MIKILRLRSNSRSMMSGITNPLNTSVSAGISKVSGLGTTNSRGRRPRGLKNRPPRSDEGSQSDNRTSDETRSISHHHQRPAPRSQCFHCKMHTRTLVLRLCVERTLEHTLVHSNSSPDYRLKVEERDTGAIPLQVARVQGIPCNYNRMRS